MLAHGPLVEVTPLGGAWLRGIPGVTVTLKRPQGCPALFATDRPMGVVCSDGTSQSGGRARSLLCVLPLTRPRRSRSLPSLRVCGG